MKNIILLLICALPIIAFAQCRPIIYIVDTSLLKSGATILYGIGGGAEFMNSRDTAAAYLLVTTERGLAQQRRGYVVYSVYNENIYLDCNKKVIKPPYTVWQYRVINKN